MATLYYERDADPGVLRARRVAVIGYGSQGHAHALNLRDNGIDVRIGLPAGRPSRQRALDAGFKVMTPAEAAAWANVIVLLVPDTSQPALYRDEIEPNLNRGDVLLFSHGFNIRFGTITPGPDVDVVMVAPKAPGHRLREVFAAGGGTPALVAVHQDATGSALKTALSYAWAIGTTRAGVVSTTFAEETETDLFGEQAVLCGGMSALVKAGFDTLVEAGYQPEIAYFECLHELKLIVDLMYQGGLSYMRDSISDTAEHGDYTGGPRIVTAETRRAMRELLDEIRDGRYARAWIAESEAGHPTFRARRTAEQSLAIERVGARLREMMPFLKPEKAPVREATPA